MSQGAALGAMASWRGRRTLGPLLATGLVIPATAIAPAPTAAGLAALTLAGELAARSEGPHAGRRRGSDYPNHLVQARQLQAYLRWRNAHPRDPEVLAGQRRERARIRSERHQRWGRPAPQAT